MNENVKKFLEEASKNQELRNELKGSNDKEAIMKTAKAHGLELRDEDFELSEMNELSENEMKAVAGGFGMCTCMEQGHGDEEDVVCNCTGDGDGINITNGRSRCACFSFLQGAGLGLG